jgi:hypothetical protein
MKTKNDVVESVEEMKVDRNMRYLRMEALLPREKIKDRTVGVIGCGAVGRQVATALGVMGVGKMVLVDYDVVEEVNMGAQGWNGYELGMGKVDALAMEIAGDRRDSLVIQKNSKFKPGMDVGTDWFVCVDSIDVRRQIWEAFQRSKGEVLIDGRMLAETIRVVTEMRGSMDYEETLFKASEAAQGTCTGRTIYYTCMVCAGMMLSQWRKYLMRLPIEKDIMCDLTCMRMEGTNE